MGEVVHYVFVHHLRLAVHTLILFAVGLFAAFPVIRYRLTAVEWLPLRIFAFITRLMGRTPTVLRMALVIWGFNAVAMFIYMASGFHPLLPKVFAVWTGLNIAVVAVRGRLDDDPVLSAFGRARADQWRPPVALSFVCGALVLALELPCFWYALAMGISMGWQVQGGCAYLDALGVRALAYVSIVVPVLLVSALAESVAIRAAARPAEWDA